MGIWYQGKVDVLVRVLNIQTYIEQKQMSLLNPSLAKTGQLLLGFKSTRKIGGRIMTKKIATILCTLAAQIAIVTVIPHSAAAEPKSLPSDMKK